MQLGEGAALGVGMNSRSRGVAVEAEARRPSTSGGLLTAAMAETIRLSCKELCVTHTQGNMQLTQVQCK